MNSLIDKYVDYFTLFFIITDTGGNYSSLYSEKYRDTLPDGCIIPYTISEEYYECYQRAYPKKGEKVYMLHDYGERIAVSKKEHVYLVKSIDNDSIYVFGSNSLSPICHYNNM